MVLAQVKTSQTGCATIYKYRNLAELKRVINGNLADYIILDNDIVEDQKAYDAAIGFNLCKLLHCDTRDGLRGLFNLSWTTPRNSNDVHPQFGSNFFKISEKLAELRGSPFWVLHCAAVPELNSSVDDLLHGSGFYDPAVKRMFERHNSITPFDLACALGKHSAKAEERNLVVHTASRLIVIDVDVKKKYRRFCAG